jgi:lipopolysaccharide biosynthesis glycosyltransferase
MTKTIIYSCVFFNIKYINLINLLLKSYKLFGNPSDDIDYLVICSPNFQKKIQEIFYTLNIKGKIWCLDFKTKFDACCSRLKIFDYPDINLYNKILYLDCDIIISKSINNILNFELENKLYALKENCDRRCHCDIFTDEEYKLFDKSSAFSSGILLFNNNPIIKKLFSQIIFHINEELVKYNYELVFQQNKEVDFSIIFGDQPFLVYYSVKNNLYDNQKLINLVINNPKKNKGQTISHFSGCPGHYKSKFRKMRRFMKRFMS